MKGMQHRLAGDGRVDLASAKTEGQRTGAVLIVSSGFGGADEADFLQRIVRAVADARGLANESVSSAADVTHGQFAESARDVDSRVAVGGAVSVAAVLVSAHRSAERQTRVGFARSGEDDTDARAEQGIGHAIDVGVGQTHAGRTRQGDFRGGGASHQGQRAGREKKLFHFSLFLQGKPAAGESAGEWIVFPP